MGLFVATSPTIIPAHDMYHRPLQPEYEKHFRLKTFWFQHAAIIVVSCVVVTAIGD